MDKYENIEKVKRLDFDRLDSLVSERLGALKIYAQTVGQTESVVHAAISRDLILPCVYTLVEFLDSVKIEDSTDESRRHRCNDRGAQRSIVETRVLVWLCVGCAGGDHCCRYLCGVGNGASTSKD